MNYRVFKVVGNYHIQKGTYSELGTAFEKAKECLREPMKIYSMIKGYDDYGSKIEIVFYCDDDKLKIEGEDAING